MKKKNRYDTSNLMESQFEPGSNGKVLKNKLGLISAKEIDQIEAEMLEIAIDKLIRTCEEDHKFTAADICNIHKIWLGNLYEWAGDYRKVNVSKDGFPFAAAAHIPALMAEFEKDSLDRLTPCNDKDLDNVTKALAEVHTELVLIHPFREGNGRLARIISTLMVLQAGLPLLDFNCITGNKRDVYFSAVRAGLDRNYEPMEKIFREIIEKTLSSS